MIRHFIGEPHVNIFPTGRTTRAQETACVAQVALVKGIGARAFDRAQIGDVLAREALPCGRVREHKVSVNEQ